MAQLYPESRDERLLFFPTAASWDESRQTWRIPIHVWSFEPEKDSIARKLALRRLRDLLTRYIERG